MSLTLDSHLILVPLEIRKDKKHYIVEDKTSGEFYEMPEICIVAIKLINEGIRLGDIERQLKWKYPNDDVDLIDFVKSLLAMKLITKLDDENIEYNRISNDAQRFLWISPKIGNLFFSKAACFIYIILFLMNLFLFMSKPSLFPHYKDLFIFNYMTLNIPAWLFITFCLVLVHEFGHILAMRAHNLSTKLEVGHRLFLVVLETDMSSVWKLPSKDRNVLYLAGVCFDTVILSVALVCQLLIPNESGIFNGILSIIVLDIFIRMVYQLCVYMKTDFYYVLENVTGCYNLMENAQQMIRKKLPMLRSNIKEDEVFAGERKTVFLYSILYFIGVVVTVALYIIFYIPQLLFAWKKVLPGFFNESGSYPFWDALLFSLQILLGLGLLLYSWRKKYVQR